MAFRAEGLAARLGGRMKALGFINTKGQPDVPRFATELRYQRQSVYNWLKGTTPDNKALRRLEDDLGVPWPWLLIGDDGYKAIKFWEDSGRKKLLRKAGAADAAG